MGWNEIRLEQRNSNRTSMRGTWYSARILGLGIPHGRRSYDPFLYHPETSLVEHLHKLCLLYGIYVDFNLLPAYLLSSRTECQSNDEWCGSATLNHQHHIVWDAWWYAW